RQQPHHHNQPALHTRQKISEWKVTNKFCLSTAVFLPPYSPEPLALCGALSVSLTHIKLHTNQKQHKSPAQTTFSLILIELGFSSSRHWCHSEPTREPTGVDIGLTSHTRKQQCPDYVSTKRGQYWKQEAPLGNTDRNIDFECCCDSDYGDGYGPARTGG